jgi:hypothetical protein
VTGGAVAVALQSNGLAAIQNTATRIIAAHQYRFVIAV